MIRRVPHAPRVGGFTLVELLIVIAILITVLGLGIASFNSFNRREAIKQAGLTLKSNLRFSQTKSISAQKPSSGCTTYTGMRISFTVSTYAAQHTCSPEGLTGAIVTTALPSGVTFSPVPADFTFLTVSSTVNISADRTLTLTNGVYNYSLVISPNGNIRDLGIE